MFTNNEKIIMFTQSLKEAVERNHKESLNTPMQEGEEESLLQKKLSQEHKENYEGWLNDPITKQVLLGLEEEVMRNNVKLLKHCLGTGLDRPVEDRKVLYHSLKNKVIEELLRVLRK